MTAFRWLLVAGLVLSTSSSALLAQLPIRPPGAPGSPQNSASSRSSAEPASVGSVEISETKLPPYTATMVKIEANEITIRLGEESQSLSLDQLLRAKFAGTESRAGINDLIVELADGSVIRCQKLTSNGKELQLTSSGTILRVPTRQVSSCLIRALDPVVSNQWESIIESKISSDALVLQRSPESLDKIEGLINEITESAVKFQFDGQNVDVQRTKLAGWRYFTSSSDKGGKLLAVIRDRAASNWMVQKIVGDWSRPENEIEMTLVCGAVVKLPANSIHEIDFSFGSMRFLADLEPLERKVQPRLALTAKMPEAEKLFGPRPAAAQSVRGATAGPGIDFLGSGAVVYRVPNDFKRLQGSVSLAPDGPQYTPCKAQVMLEDKVLWEKTLTTPQESFPIDLAVDAGKRLRLVVQAESAQPVGDLVSWRQLRFVK